jgi:hypothetical protein
MGTGPKQRQIVRVQVVGNEYLVRPVQQCERIDDRAVATTD